MCGKRAAKTRTAEGSAGGRAGRQVAAGLGAPARRGGKPRHRGAGRRSAPRLRRPSQLWC